MLKLVSYGRHLPKLTGEELYELFQRMRQQGLEKDLEEQEHAERPRSQPP